MHARTQEWTPDHGYNNSSPGEPAAQVSLNGLSMAFIITLKMTLNHDVYVNSVTER